MSAVNKLEYPFYLTDGKLLNVKSENTINPYEELVEFAVSTYYDKIKKSNLSFEDFFKKDGEDKKTFICDALQDIGTDFVIRDGDVYKANNRNGVISYSSIHFFKDEVPVCNLFFDYVESYYVNEDIPAPQRMIRVCFKEMESLKFLIENTLHNEFVFHEIMQGVERNDQLNVVMCVLSAILNINEFIKFHKMKSIKMNTISSYLKAHPGFYDKIYIMYNYDNAYLTYSDGTEIKIYVIDYNNHINDIDRILKNYGYNN